MVSESDGDHPFPVRGTEVETVRCSFGSKFAFLKLQNLDYSLHHGCSHLVDWIFALPGVLVATVGQIGNIQCGSMLGIRRPKHIAVSIIRQYIFQISADVRERGDHAIVHEDVAAKDKGMTIRLRNNRT